MLLKVALNSITPNPFMVPELCPLIKNAQILWFLYSYFSFFLSDVLTFLHNVFYDNTQVKYNFDYYAFYVSHVMPPFTLTGNMGIGVLCVFGKYTKFVFFS